MNTPSKHKQIETFYLLDFDRCLGNVTELYGLLVRVLEAMGVTTAHQLAQVREQVESTGGSFDAVRYLFTSGLLEEATYLELRQRYEAAADVSKLRNPGASELIEVLSARGEQYGILTYGGDLWQQTKLAGARLGHIPHLVTQVKQKGALVRGWQSVEGGFILPGELSAEPLRAQALVLIDDKAVSFDGFPVAPSRGYHVFDPDDHVSSQEGSVPSNVTQVRNLSELVLIL